MNFRAFPTGLRGDFRKDEVDSANFRSVLRGFTGFHGRYKGFSEAFQSVSEDY